MAEIKACCRISKEGHTHCMLRVKSSQLHVQKALSEHRKPLASQSGPAAETGDTALGKYRQGGWRVGQSWGDSRHNDSRDSDIRDSNRSGSDKFHCDCHYGDSNVSSFASQVIFDLLC